MVAVQLRPHGGGPRLGGAPRRALLSHRVTLPPVAAAAAAAAQLHPLDLIGRVDAAKEQQRKLLRTVRHGGGFGVRGRAAPARDCWRVPGLTCWVQGRCAGSCQRQEPPSDPPPPPGTTPGLQL